MKILSANQYDKKNNANILTHFFSLYFHAYIIFSIQHFMDFPPAFVTITMSKSTTTILF